MDIEVKKFPVYAKLAMIITGILALFYILYIGQTILKPLVFATIIAILLNPLVNYLCRHRINRVIAIFISLLLALLLLGGLFYFIAAQISMFSETFPVFKEKFAVIINQVLGWVSDTFHISESRMQNWITKTRTQGMNNSTQLITQTLGTISGLFALLFLLPVYTFMILFYKPLLLEFIARLFSRDKHTVVAEVLLETKGLIQSYLLGLLLEAGIVAVLNSIGLLVLGIQYAILLGVIGALLNIIPYIGGLIGITLPILVAVATKSPTDALWVFLMYIFIQFLDNNFLVPKMVASKVKVNALISIIVVLIGGALWGIAGMFLSIPITAIIKVVFDRIDTLSPFGFLLGDNQPDFGKIIFKFKNPVKKSS